jgi:ribosomal protein L4
MLSTLFSSRWYFQATLIFELFSMPKISILDVWINYLLERLTINSLQGLNVYSILQHDTLVMSRDAVNKIVERMHTPIKR